VLAASVLQGIEDKEGKNIKS